MRRLVTKRLAMLGLISVFTLCAAAVSANAQITTPVRAKIPFEFSVGEKKLPAGEYILSHLSGLGDNKTLMVSSVDSGTRIFQSILATQVTTPKNQSSLVFHKYGDQYFLEAIWSGGEQAGAQLPESRSERTLRRQSAQLAQGRVPGTAMKVETIDLVVNRF